MPRIPKIAIDLKWRKKIKKNKKNRKTEDRREK